MKVQMTTPSMRDTSHAADLSLAPSKADGNEARASINDENSPMSSTTETVSAGNRTQPRNVLHSPLTRLSTGNDDSDDPFSNMEVTIKIPQAKGTRIVMSIDNLPKELRRRLLALVFKGYLGDEFAENSSEDEDESGGDCTSSLMM
jgi:hypothetical protein